MSFEILLICMFVLAGIEQDPSMSLPNSTLNFGFGFFILIVVSVRNITTNYKD